MLICLRFKGLKVLRFKGYLYDRAISYLHGGSLEITLAVPLDDFYL